MDKLELIKRNTEEIIGEKKLGDILKQKKKIVYCGYEPSGPIHIGHLVTIMKLRDLEKAGFKIKVLLADWHAWLNKKGDWKSINEEVQKWKRAFKRLGLRHPEIIIGTSFQKRDDYMDDVFTLAANSTLNRGLRAMQGIMRNPENAKVTQIIYPFMQVADMKALGVDVAVAGMEQRKIHMIAVESIKDINYKVPVFIHTSLISSLSGKGKMSSTDGKNLISINDSKEEIKKKIAKAYCPEGKQNPVLEIAKLLIFPRFEKIKIKRDKKFGGNVVYNSYGGLEKDFLSKKLHPIDLKNIVTEKLIEMFKKF